MKEERAKSKEIRAVYVISVTAEIIGVHPQTLRIYEREGLITPKRTAKGSRRYSAEDVERLRRIQELTREYGVNLAGVKMLLELQVRVHHLEDLVEEMEEKAREMELQMDVEIERIRRSYSREVVPFRRGEIMGRLS